MPSKSQAQHNYMAGVMSGNIKSDSLSPDQAAEFVKADKGKVKDLPKKKKGRVKFSQAKRLGKSHASE